MSQKLAVVNHAKESSKKCFHCGLRNYANQARCTRCRYDVWVPLTEPEKEGHLFDTLRNTLRQVSRPKVGALIGTAVLLSGLALLYLRDDPKGTPGTISQAVVALPATPKAEQPGADAAHEHRESQLAAKQVLAGLKQFHSAIQSSMTYAAYDQMLSRLKTDLNKTMPSFVDHKPGDEFFRREVNAAVRDYSAAGSWWKTVDRNGGVLTDTDRTERLTVSWTSAKTHIDNAEQMLGR